MIRILFNMTLFILLSTGGACQKNNVNDDSIAASFPGGKNELEKYLKDNRQWRQRQMTVSGKVFVSFTVKEDGNLSDIRIIKGLCKSCDKEAVRLVENMPRWEPAVKNGERINSEQTVVVKFELYNEM